MHIEKQIVLAAILLSLVGCANPLNQATSIRYSDACREAELNGRLDIAEQACYRALVNVDWGNLGEIQKSDRLYDLGRIKRQLGKFVEAEELYIASLAIEDKQIPPNYEKTGRRLAELAILYEQMQIPESGMPYVQRLYGIPYEYTGQERVVVAAVLYVYAEMLNLDWDKKTAKKLKIKAIEMGFDPKLLDQ